MWDLKIVILGLLSRFLEVPRRANLIFDILSPVRPQNPTSGDDQNNRDVFKCTLSCVKIANNVGALEAAVVTVVKF